jgi:hypothetical protein
VRTTRRPLMALITVGWLAASVPGAAAQSPEAGSEPTVPVPFIGLAEPGAQIRTGTTETVDGHVENRDYAYAPSIVQVSDARLDGELTLGGSNDEYPGPDGTMYELATEVWRIETADGAWQGTTAFFVASPDLPGSRTILLVGEGAYEGLIAAVTARLSDPWTFEGVIFPGEPPPMATTP